MTMNAMESIKDKNMLYLDLLAGISGYMLYKMVVDGWDNFDVTKLVRKDTMCMSYSLVLVLLSRVIVDYVYYVTVSKTDSFGGSNTEFGYSSLVWVILMSLFRKMTKPKMRVGKLMTHVLVHGVCTLIMLLAIARVTKWA